MNDAERAIEKLTKRLVAAAIRDRGITLKATEVPDGVDRVEVAKYLDEILLKIADKLERECRNDR